MKHSGLSFKALLELYCKYVKSNPNHIVSMGTFLALKPFYVYTATAKDIEMCVCKVHLHGRWSVKSLVTCCKENEIDIGNIVSYETLLQNLTSDCDSDSYTPLYLFYTLILVESSTIS